MSQWKLPQPQEVRGWADRLRLRPQYAPDANRLMVIADEIAANAPPGPGPTPTPGTVHPKLRIREVPITALAPDGFAHSTNWLEVNGYVEFNPDGSTKLVEMVAIKFRPPANRAAAFVDSNFHGGGTYAICDRAGIIVRGADATAGDFGAVTYGSQQWNTKPQDMAGHELVAGRDYWLCMAPIDREVFEDTGDIKIQGRIAFNNRTREPWKDAFKILMTG